VLVNTSFRGCEVMAIDEKRIVKMKELVENAKKTGVITPSEKAFVLYPPEGTWQKDENGKITIKEVSLT